MIINDTPYGEIINKIIQRIKESKFRNYDMNAIDITISLNTRMRTIGGRCRINILNSKCIIHLNKQLFDTISDEEKYDTISHELAHAMCFVYKLGRNHDYGWQIVHREMGGSSSRTHDNIVIGNKVRKVLVKYEGRLSAISPQKARKYLSMSVFDKHFNRMVLEKIGEIQMDRNNRTLKWLEKDPSVPVEKALEIIKPSHRLAWKIVA